MELSPYLTFDGRCKAAFTFYARCLGGTVEAMITHAEMGATDQVPDGWRDKIMHADLKVGDMRLLGSDRPPQYYEEKKGFSVMLDVENPAEADRVFHALAENGTVQMPIQETSWAARFGTLTDQFGVPWMINCAKAA